MAIMRSKDAVRGADAECYVTIGGNRYNFMTLKNCTATISYQNGEVKRLGAQMVGHKEGVGDGKWEATGFYGTPIFKEAIYEYKRTGFFPDFEIQVINEDKTSATGRQSVILKECLIDEAILATFDADSELIEEDISGTFDDFEMPEAFNLLSGM